MKTREGTARTRVLAALDLGPMTMEEIAIEVQLACKTVRANLLILRAAPKRVRIADYVLSETRGIWVPVYALGSGEDKAMPPKEDIAKYLHSKRGTHKVDYFQPAQTKQNWCSALFAA